MKDELKIRTRPLAQARYNGNQKIDKWEWWRAVERTRDIKNRNKMILRERNKESKRIERILKERPSSKRTLKLLKEYQKRSKARKK